MMERTKEMKRTAAVVVLLLSISVCVMLYCEWRGTLSDTVLTAVCVCFVMGFLADNIIILAVQYIVNTARRASKS